MERYTLNTISCAAFTFRHSLYLSGTASEVPITIQNMTVSIHTTSEAVAVMCCLCILATFFLRREVIQLRSIVLREIRERESELEFNLPLSGLFHGIFRYSRSPLNTLQLLQGILSYVMLILVRSSAPLFCCISHGQKVTSSDHHAVLQYCCVGVRPAVRVLASIRLVMQCFDLTFALRAIESTSWISVVLITAISDLFPVMLIFSVWWLGFAGTFFALMGYASVPDALLGTLQLMLGELDLDTFRESSFSSLLYLGFAAMVIIAVVALLNMTISLVTDTWTDVKKNRKILFTKLQARVLSEVCELFLLCTTA